MKKILLALSILFVPALAHAQCTGVFPANTLCGNLSGTPQPPAAFSASTSLVGPGSSTVGDVAIWNNTLGNLFADSKALNLAATQVVTLNNQFQLQVNTAVNNVFDGIAYNNFAGIYLYDFTSGATPSTQTLTGSGTVIAQLQYRASDGVAFRDAAWIIGKTDSNNAPAANSMPGQIQFLTTPKNSVTPLVRMEIESIGTVQIGSNPTPNVALDLSVGDNGGSCTTSCPFIAAFHRNDSDQPANGTNILVSIQDDKLVAGTGARNTLQVEQDIEGDAGGGHFFTAVVGLAYAKFNGSSYTTAPFGGNFIAQADSGLPNVNMSAAEFNTNALGTINEKVGIQVVDEGTSTGGGTTLDAGIIIGKNSGGRGYNNGIQFGFGLASEINNAFLFATSPISVPIGIDFSNATFTTAAWNADFTLTRHFSNKSGTLPTAGTCPGFTLKANSGDTAGALTMTSATTCSINFGVAYGSPPACVIAPGSSVSTVEAFTSTTQLSVAFGTAQTGFSWFCGGF